MRQAERVEDLSVSVVLLAGGVGKRMGVRHALPRLSRDFPQQAVDICAHAHTLAQTQRLLVC